jgi:cell division protein FtsZ
MSNPEMETISTKPTIRIIGLGETGVKLVETLALIVPERIEVHSLDTDNRSLIRCHQSRTHLLGQTIPCGLGTGGDPALARAAVESDIDKLEGIFQGVDLIFVVAGMGGGTGTGAAPVLASLAKQSGALVVGVAATPFDCEGIQRCNQAIGGLRDLKQVADAVFHFPNQDVIVMEGADIALNQALDIANRHLCEAVLGVSRMLVEPGMLNISFGDLQVAFRGRHSLGSVVHVEAEGENRADAVVRRLLTHPAARGGEGLSEASSVLIHLSGGEVTMAEMDAVSKVVNSYASGVSAVVGVCGQSDGATLQATIIIVQNDKLAEADQETLPNGQASSLGGSDTFTVAGADSYLDLVGEESTGKNRVGFAYTPPAPAADTLTPECREYLIREAASEEPNRAKRRKIVQEMLPLEIVSKGRFENSEPTIHKGEDLDQPTYIRRGIVLN